MFILGLFAGALLLWFGFCGVLIALYVKDGHKHDHSGDGAIALLCLPIMPFMWAFWKVHEGVQRVKKVFGC